MEPNYDALREELLARRDQLRPLTQQPRIVGDYHEALIRELVSRFIDDRLLVKQGLVFDRKGRKSRECDIINYEKGRKPLFEVGGLAIVNEEDVRFVMQIKSKLTSKTLKDAIDNLREAKKLNNQIMCWIVGFETNLLLRTLYLKAWRSKVIQFLQVFHSDRKKEAKSLLEDQMKFFVTSLRRCREFGMYSYTNDLVIHQEDRGYRLALGSDRQEIEILSLLSQIYSKGFSNFERGKP